MNRLFDVHPRGHRPYSNADVVRGLTAAGHRISKSYMTQLRSGNRINPSEETVAALARFFGVTPDYFYDPVYQNAVDSDLATLTQLRNTGLRRLSTRAFGLPEESQMLLISMAEKLRASEGLPAVPPDCTPSSNVLDT
ncbi:helix-turn-helix domain-containing protein [Rhodococcoides yunnanense]|uniref:helix-turn-helix domain-containing protein n=1 Tax=Rhodococcoides yunnanense TaxID=278209 RepID=UPI0022B0FE5F|nr:helix-turn-helix transcriptional regulator [Rhodococcus yunnanensis]MCZ4277752.1 helix-turn-helix transcriptional regulator [Rhodococcus yunnanensis]